jgi:low temperature requirement protein LtrA
MKTMINTFGALLIVIGIMMMAGSAGDCDGKCMESANTLTEMLMYSLMGLALLLVGGFIAIKSN